MELRRGSNRWALTVAPDGRMPLGGLAPSRILWHTPPPATLLPDTGVRLDTLSISTPDVAALRPFVADVVGPVEVTHGAFGLTATFSTPSGQVAIGGPSASGRSTARGSHAPEPRRGAAFWD